MSIENAQLFIEKCKNDEDLQKRLHEAQDNESKLEIAREAGCDFIVEEIKKASEMMSEDELEDLMDRILPVYSCRFDRYMCGQVR